MWRLLGLLTALLLAAAGCRTETANEQERAESFALAGRVTEVQSGVEPTSVPDPTDQVGDNAETGGEQREDDSPSEGGSLLVSVDNPNELDDQLRGCLTGGGYLIFFTTGTTITPSSIVRDDEFPENLHEEEVEVNGTLYPQDTDASCQLIANSIAVSESPAEQTHTPGPIPSGSTGGRAGSSASPGPGGAPPQTASPTPAPNQQ